MPPEDKDISWDNILPPEEEEELDQRKKGTDEIIEDARRPVLIQRHREEVSALEKDIDDSDLEAGDEQEDRLGLLRRLATEQAAAETPLRELLIRELCVLREDETNDEATLRGLAVELYRQTATLLHQRSNVEYGIFDVRALPGNHLQRLFMEREIVFGTPEMHNTIPVPNAQFERRYRIVKRLSRARGGDDNWMEAAGEPRLSRSSEAPLMELPEEERKAARAELIAHTIRSYFYRSVFRKYFDRDTLDPNEIASHPTILDWLLSIEETPHLYPFMAGQTQTQKMFRLSRLLRKIIATNELYQRVALGSSHPTYRGQLEGKSTRERLSILAKDRYPPMQVDDTFMVLTVSCPFPAFAAWVQDKSTNHDLVLPPDA